SSAIISRRSVPTLTTAPARPNDTVTPAVVCKSCGDLCSIGAWGGFSLGYCGPIWPLRQERGLWKFRQLREVHGPRELLHARLYSSVFGVGSDCCGASPWTRSGVRALDSVDKPRKRCVARPVRHRHGNLLWLQVTARLLGVLCIRCCTAAGIDGRRQGSTSIRDDGA